MKLLNLNHQKLSSYHSKESHWGDEVLLPKLLHTTILLIVPLGTLTYPINVERGINETRIYFYWIKSRRKGGNFLLNVIVLGSVVTSAKRGRLVSVDSGLEIG